MKRRRLRDNAEILEEAKLISYLRSCGMKTNAIADHLHQSPATISRRLELARDKHILVEKHIAHLEPEEIERFELFTLEQELSKALSNEIGQRLVRHITIVPSEEGKDKVDANISRIGTFAALRLWQHRSAGRMHTVGVSWGRTVAATASAAGLLSPTVSVETQVEFIPIVGDHLLSTRPNIYKFSASTVAAELTKAFQGDLEKQHHLSTPSCIPEDFFQDDVDQTAAEKQLIRRFLKTLSSHQEVFGPGEGNQEPAIQRLDTLISGCGFIDANDGSVELENRKDSMWFNFTKHVRPAERAELRKAAIGDLCGRLVARPDADTAGKRLVDEINERAFASPTLQDIRRCKEQARQNQTPGVIIVCAGAEKAGTLLSICLDDLVSEIVIDKDLAIEVANLLDIEVNTLTEQSQA